MEKTKKFHISFKIPNKKNTDCLVESSKPTKGYFNKKNENEDIAFGSLDFFLLDDDKTIQRIRDFYRY